MCGVEHTLSLFFNDVSKIPILNQMISSHKMIYNIFGCGIYHKPHSIFKSKYQDFHKRKIGIFSGNEAITAGYFMGIHRDLRMQKIIQDTIAFAQLLSITTTTKLTKSLKYINDDKSREWCYLLLKIFFTLP